MKAKIVVFFGIVIIAGAALFLFNTSQNSQGIIEEKKVSAFMRTTPSLQKMKVFLKSNAIDFTENAIRDSPPGDVIRTIFDLSNRQKISYLSVRVHGVEKTWCGRIDRVFMIVYDKQGRMMESKNIRMETACLDF